MANSHLKRCSTTLVEEMQIRTESNTTTHPLECLKCTGHSKQGCGNSADKNVNWYNHALTVSVDTIL